MEFKGHGDFEAEVVLRNGVAVLLVPVFGEGDVRLDGIDEFRHRDDAICCCGCRALFHLAARRGGCVAADWVLRHDVDPRHAVGRVLLQFGFAFALDVVYPGVGIFFLRPRNRIRIRWERFLGNRVVLAGLRIRAARERDLDVLGTGIQGVAIVFPTLFAPQGDGFLLLAGVEEGRGDRNLRGFCAVFHPGGRQAGDFHGALGALLLLYGVRLHRSLSRPGVVPLEEAVLDLRDGVDVGRSVGGVELQVLDGKDLLHRCASRAGGGRIRLLHLVRGPSHRLDVFRLRGLSFVVRVRAGDLELHRGVRQRALLPHRQLEVLLEGQAAGVRRVGIGGQVRPRLNRGLKDGVPFFRSTILHILVPRHFHFAQDVVVEIALLVVLGQGLFPFGDLRLTRCIFARVGDLEGIGPVLPIRPIGDGQLGNVRLHQFLAFVLVHGKRDGGQIRRVPASRQGRPDLLAPDGDVVLQAVDEGAVLLQGVEPLACAGVLQVGDVYDMGCFIHRIGGAADAITVELILHLHVVDGGPVDHGVLGGVIEDLVSIVVVPGQAGDLRGPVALLVRSRSLLVHPAVVAHVDLRGLRISVCIVLDLVDVQVDVRAQVARIGVLVVPLLVPVDGLGLLEPVGDVDGGRVLRVVRADLVFRLADRPAVLVEAVLDVLGNNFHFCPGSIFSLLDHDLLDGIGDGRALLIVLGEVEEVEGLRLVALRQVAIFRQEDLHGLGAIARRILNEQRLAAEGDGIRPNHVPLLHLAVELEVQGEGHILLSQCCLQRLCRLPVAVDPLLGDGQVNAAQAAVRDDVAVLILDLLIQIGGLVVVVRACKLDGSISFRLLRFIGRLFSGPIGIVLQGDTVLPDLRLEDVDFIGLQGPDAHELLPDAVLAEDDRVSNRCIRRAVIDLDRHRLAVGDVAVVDPLLAHENAVALARRVVDVRPVVAFLVARGLIGREVVLRARALEQDVLVGAALLVELGQARELRDPRRRLLHGDGDVRLPGPKLRGRCVLRPVHGERDICLLGQRLPADRAVEGKRDLRIFRQNFQVFVCIVLAIAVRIPVLLHVVVDGIGDGVRHGGVAALLVHLHGGPVLDDALALLEGEGSAAVVVRLEEVLRRALALVDGGLDPAVFQLAAERVVLRGGVRVGHGQVLGVEIVQLRRGLRVLPRLLGTRGPGLQGQHDLDVLELRLEGGGVPVLCRTGLDAARAPVAEDAAVVEVGVPVRALAARDALDDVAGDGAVLVHLAEYLLVLHGSARHVLAHDVDVAVALGVVLVEHAPGRSVGQRAALALRQLDDVAVAVAHGRGGVIALPLAVAPELIGDVRAARIVSAVKPMLRRVVIGLALQGDDELAARVQRRRIRAIVGRVRVVEVHDEVVAHLQDALQRLAEQAFRRMDGVDDGRAVQVVLPGVRYGQAAGVSVRRDSVDVDLRIAFQLFQGGVPFQVPVSVGVHAQMEVFANRRRQRRIVIGDRGGVDADVKLDVRQEDIVPAGRIDGGVAALFDFLLRHLAQLVPRDRFRPKLPLDVADEGVAMDVLVDQGFGQHVVRDGDDAGRRVVDNLRHGIQTELRKIPIRQRRKLAEVAIRGRFRDFVPLICSRPVMETRRV